MCCDIYCLVAVVQCNTQTINYNKNYTFCKTTQSASQYKHQTIVDNKPHGDIKELTGAQSWAVKNKVDGIISEFGILATQVAATI